MSIGRVGIWSPGLRASGARDPGELRDAAAELEHLGYGALWIPGTVEAHDFDNATLLLDATTTLVVATGILNIWLHDADVVAGRTAELDVRYPRRFLLGLGAGHPELVDTPDRQRFRRPVAAVERFLDQLDAAVPPVHVERRLLAALGPVMTGLAGKRSAGAHPYLVTVEHVRQARAALGPSALLAPELAVVLEQEPDRARALARTAIGPHLRLGHYSRNLIRLGYTFADLADGGSDRLIDALVAWGDEVAIAERVASFHEAGADHVALQVLTDEETGLPREQWRRLAETGELGTRAAG